MGVVRAPGLYFWPLLPLDMSPHLSEQVNFTTSQILVLQHERVG